MSDPIPNDAARVIEAFGGIRPMAKKLGVAVTTIQGWKERNAIPIRRLDEIRTAAAREGIDLGALAVPTESPAEQSPVEDSGAASPAGDAPFSERPARSGPARAETVEAEPLRADRPVQTPSGVKEAASAATGPTVDAVPAKPDGRRRAFAFGLGFAAMLIAGALIGWAIADRAGGQADNADLLAALEKRLGAAEKRLGAAEKRLGAAEKTAADAAAAAAVARSAAAAAGREADKLAGRLNASEAAQAALAGKVAATDNSAAVEALGTAVKAVRADVERLRQAVAASRDDGKVAKLAADLAGLQATAAALQKAVAEAAERPAGREGADEATRTALKELSQGLSALSEKVVALDKERAAAADRALSGLTARLAAVETRLNSVRSGSGAAGIVVALSQLRAVAASGRPYAAALAAARELAGGHAAAAAVLSALAPAAAGAPTLPVLRRDFDALSPALIAAATRTQGEGWLDRAWNKLKSTVVVRRTGRSVAGDSPSALVAQAETELADGDLGSAIALVRRMPTPAQQVAAGWLARAERRAGIDAALAKLDALMPALSSGGGTR